MNLLTAALVQISPLHVRQLLFLCLAALLTLVAGQMYSIWQSKQIANQMSVQAYHVAHVQATRASMLEPGPRHVPTRSMRPPWKPSCRRNAGCSDRAMPHI